MTLLRDLAAVLIAAALVTAGVVAAGEDGPETGPWQRIHGTVQAVEGTRLTFTTGDGHVLDVDMTHVAEAVRNVLTPGEGATVIGQYRDEDRTAVVARYIQQDSSVPAAAPKTPR